MSAREIVLVSDVHGDFEALSKALSPDDILIVAGDLLPLMDFYDYSKGILSFAFKIDELAEAVVEMSQGRFDRVREGIKEITTPGREKYELLLPHVEKLYGELARSLVCETYLIFGNVDYPDILKQTLAGTAEVIEGGVITIDGLRIGLVSGMPAAEFSIGLPGEVPDDHYKKHFDALGAVDVIVTHIPPEESPRESDLTFDTIAKRHEQGSRDLFSYIKKHRPLYSFFGHVHNPKVGKSDIDGTTAINLGFFKLHKKITRLDPKTKTIREVTV
jgi:Icc-related predicted phosphoesterase